MEDTIVEILMSLIRALELQEILRWKDSIFTKTTAS